MSFAAKLIAWQRRHGRHDLPWQGTRDPYRIWLSEVMLQQTQVATVIPYYRRFLRAFPTVRALARASQEQVLELWSGLGYYARGRNLHLAARKIASERAGRFPATARELATLPGVGRSTAAAIAVFAFGERAAILDANSRRVLARSHAVRDSRELWTLAERLVPKRGVERYTQALMDLGATVCTRGEPRCERCPVQSDCVARREGRSADFPAVRAPRERPERQTTWLVLRANGAVLLERRPAPGIWGGLWSFPELSATKRVAEHCRRRYGCDIAPPQRLAPLEHGFTHFKLRIHPLLCEVKRPGSQPVQGRWLTLDAAHAAALPSPVKALLARLSAGAA